MEASMALNRITAALLGVSIMVAPALAQDTPPVPPPAAAAPTPPLPAPPPATTGRIYVSYAQQPHADFSSQLAIDDAWLSNAVSPGTCVYFDLSPGTHSLHTLADRKLSVDLSAGGAKYVELQVRHMYMDGGSQDVVFPESVASIADTSGCKASPAP
jgi:hypothetical protein